MSIRDTTADCKLKLKGTRRELQSAEFDTAEWR